MTHSIINMIRDVEFSNDNSLLLHHNEGETGLTYFGIYESDHPNWYGWNVIKRYLVNTPDLKECSKILANVSDLNQKVEEFYKKEFFDKLKLDLVKSVDKQEEIMCFAINVGLKPCIKKLQECLGVNVDGITGQQTINALNAFDESLFDKLFDIEEKEYYDSLPSRLDRYKKGLKNRADKY